MCRSIGGGGEQGEANTGALVTDIYTHNAHRFFLRLCVCELWRTKGEREDLVSKMGAEKRDENGGGINTVRLGLTK